MKISELLKTKRLSCNLTQKQMAEEIGICKVTYNRIENGYKNIGLQVIEKLHQFTGLSYEEIRNNL